MINVRDAYRIFEVRHYTPSTLFHGVNGSRLLSLNAWHIAKMDQVRDGTSKTCYTSGFHTTLTRTDAEMYLSRFKKPRHLVICRILIGGKQWPKEHSPSPIVLSEKIRISSWMWSEALVRDDVAQTKLRAAMLTALAESETSIKDFARNVKMNGDDVYNCLFDNHPKYDTTRRYVAKFLL